MGMLRQLADSGRRRPDVGFRSGFFCEFLEFQIATPTFSRKERNQYPPCWNKWQAYPPIGFVLTAAFYRVKDSKYDYKYAGNAEFER